MSSRRKRIIIYGFVSSIVVALIGAFSDNFTLIYQFLKTYNKEPVTIVYNDANLELTLLNKHQVKWLNENKENVKETYHQLLQDTLNTCDLSVLFYAEVPDGFFYNLKLTLYNNSDEDLFFKESRAYLDPSQETRSAVNIVKSNSFYSSPFPILLKSKEMAEVVIQIEYTPPKYALVGGTLDNPYSRIKIGHEDSLVTYYSYLLQKYKECSANKNEIFYVTLIDQHNREHSIRIDAPF